MKNFILNLITLRWLRRILHYLATLTLWQLIKGVLALLLGLTLLAALALFALIHYPATQIPTYEPVAETLYLDQNWGKDADSAQRQTYYYTPQGTSLKGLEYQWFTHLEMPWGQHRFSAPEHMKAYGFIVDDKASARNPMQLPLGFTKHYDQSSNAELLDISCAACHSGQLNITKDGKRYAVRIDGGQAMHAFTTMKVGHFVPTLLAALTSTYLNPFKFDRFAHGVLASHYDDNSKSELHQRLGTVLWRFIKQGYNDASKGLYPLEEGFGRTDALTRIGNTVFGDNLSAGNYHVATGPVSYPPVWNIWKFDWVQYGASVKQPMARNMGEALGVGAHIAFTDAYGEALAPEQRFNSSVMPENINKIETTLQQLTPPQWPEQLFGPIDRQKAAAGKKLFEQHCQGCHGPHPADAQVKQIDMPLKTPTEALWRLTTFPISDIGTDANTAFNFISYKFDLGKTGLTAQDVELTVRPILVQQLKRLTKVALNDETLVDFLSSSAPRADDPLLQSNNHWPAQHPAQFDAIAADFSNWHHLDTLASTIAQQGDNDTVRAINNALIKQQLKAIDNALAQLDIKTLTVGEALNLTGIIIREKYYRDQHFSAAKQACLDGFAALDLPQQPLAYKARPLEGIWATPPFLHNGSVPNIYQLLSPVIERDSQFYVGSRDYDVKRLGYDSASKNGFLFDTTLSGNHNTGHEFRDGYVPYKPGNAPQYGVIGPALSPEQRWQLIEYLKIHRDSDNTDVPPAQNCAAL